jgi:hypothetical protein
LYCSKASISLTKSCHRTLKDLQSLCGSIELLDR